MSADVDSDVDTVSGEPGLARSAATGVAWLTVQKWVVRVSGLATIAVLARHVSPHEFGVVAAAAVVLPFVLLVSDLGLSTYLVQSDRADQRALSTGLWFSLVSACVAGAALLALAPLLAAALRIPEAAAVLRVLLVSVPLVVLGSVPTALLRRRMQFRRLAVQGTIASAVAQVVAVAVALAGGGAWALVAQTLCASTLTTAMVWISARWRPTLEFSWQEFGSMAQYGYKVVAAELVAVLRGWGETAVIALALGSTALGYLAIAQRLVQVAQDLGGSAIAPVSIVVLAKVRDAPERLRAAYQRASTVLYAAALPILTVTSVAAPALIPLIFGPEWLPSVPVTRGLAVAGILTLGAVLDQGLFYALGRPGTWLTYGIVTDLVTVGATAAVVSQGLAAVAWAFVAVAMAATVARWLLIARTIGAPVRSQAWAFAKIALCVAGSGLAGLCVLNATSGPPIVAVAATAATVGVVHVALVRLILPGTLREILDLGPVPAGLSRRVARLVRLRPA